MESPECHAMLARLRAIDIHMTEMIERLKDAQTGHEAVMASLNTSIEGIRATDEKLKKLIAIWDARTEQARRKRDE
jgi:cell division protein ZapA (FtsZ GTPase activity inhibitor)